MIRYHIGNLPPSDDVAKNIEILLLHPGARPIFQRMLDSLVQRQRFAFNIGGHHTRGGARWAPLAPRTVKEKRDGGWSPLILVRTTELKLANEGKLRPGSDSMVLELFNRTPYYGEHAKGVPERRLPKRPPIQITERDIEFLRAEVVRGMMAFVNG